MPGEVLYRCEHCPKMYRSMWAAAYCCDPWPAEEDQREIRRARKLRFPHP